MARIKFIPVILLISLCSFGQSKNQKTVVDGDKKFLYFDSSGVTASYIRYFGDIFPIPDLTTIDGN